MKNKIIRSIMRTINRNRFLWNLFNKFPWYRSELNKQAHMILREHLEGKNENNK